MKVFLGFIMCLSIISCQNRNLMINNLDIQGHRGCRGLLPENTIEGFLRAVDLGVTTLELDVVISKDSQVVVSHEPFFNHEITTHPDGTEINEANAKTYNIYEMTYEEVKSYDVGSKGNPKFPIQTKIKAYKPTLSALIDTVEQYIKTKSLSSVHYNIEIKYDKNEENKYHPSAEVFTKLVYDLIITKGMKEKSNIQCFDEKPLNILHKIDASMATAFLVGETGHVTEKLAKLDYKPTIYSPHYRLVDEALVKYCHENSIKIIPWTVNEEKEIIHIIKIGVDGIISDYPDKVIEIYEGIRDLK
jgi:glycerophosphoryl diester phosphodiesterase